jgi:hypothetical protein
VSVQLPFLSRGYVEAGAVVSTSTLRVYETILPTVAPRLVLGFWL